MCSAVLPSPEVQEISEPPPHLALVALALSIGTLFQLLIPKG